MIPFRQSLQRSAGPVLVPNVNRKVKRDFRLWLGVGLLLASIFTISHLISAAGSRTLAVALTHDVVPGTKLTEADLELVRVSLPSADKYFNSLDSAVGVIAGTKMQAGELIPISGELLSTGANLRRVSLPIRAGHLPAIQIGQSVDVWSTPSVDGVQVPGPPKLISKAVSVADVPAEIDPTAETAISILIPISEVQTVIQAMRDGLIDVVVVPEKSRSVS